MTEGIQQLACCTQTLEQLQQENARLIALLEAHGHGFIKKSQATPPEELDVAKRRLQQLRSAS